MVIYLSILLGVLFFFCSYLVKHLVDPEETYKLAELSVSLRFKVINGSLTISILCVVIIPFDIYVTANPIASISRQTLRDIILYLFVSNIVFSFVVIPFSYFYGEERGEYIDFIDSRDDKSIITRIANSFKYTIFFVIGSILLVIVCLAMRPGNSFEKGKELEWAKKLFDVEKSGETAIFFTIAILNGIGALPWPLYSGYGIAVLPWELIKGTKSLAETKSEIDEDLDKIKGKFLKIQEKYSKSHTKVSKNDQKLLTSLKKKEKYLTEKTSKISEVEGRRSIFSKLVTILKPFRITIGILFLGLSLIILLSLIATTIDKVLNSKCGFKCAFFIEKQNIINPLDYLLIKANKYFLLDFLAFFLLTIFIFLATLFGFVKLGIKFLFFTIFELKRKSSMPQALLMMAFMMNLLILSLNSQLMILAPQYTTFGSQFYMEGNDKVLCSISQMNSNANTNCVISNLSSYINKFMVTLPLLAMIFFCSNVAFIALNSLFTLIACFRGRKHQIEVYS